MNMTVFIYTKCQSKITKNKMITHRAIIPLFKENGELKKIVQLEILDQNQVLNPFMSQEKITELANNLKQWWTTVGDVRFGSENEYDPITLRVENENLDHIKNILEVGEFTINAPNKIRSVVAVTLASQMSDRETHQFCDNVVNIICDIMP